MQFTFVGPRSDKKLIDRVKPPELSRSKFMRLLVLEGICTREKELAKKKTKKAIITS